MVLPATNLEDRTVGKMFPGEVAYTFPGALIVHENRRCFLNGNFKVRDDLTLISTLKVIRRKDGKYEVDISGCLEERWATSRAEGIEVVNVHGGREGPKVEEESETARGTSSRKLKL